MPISLAQIGITVALTIGSALLARRRKGDLPERPGGTIRLSSAPAQSVVGRARTGGLLAYPPVEDDPLDPATNAGRLETKADDGYRDVHLALAISEGACDGVEAVWLDGLRYDLRIDDTEADGALRYRASSPVPPYASADGDLFAVRACFSASGTQGAAFRAAAHLPSGASFLRGVSWIHLHLRQPVNPGDREERGVGWDRLPEVEFLIRGVEIGASWTDSAASIREWWHRTVLGDTTPFDADALAAAKTRGDARITTALAGNYWKYEPPVAGPDAEPRAWGDMAVEPTMGEPVVWATERLMSGQLAPGERPEPFVGVWQPPFPHRVRHSDGTLETLQAVSTEDDVEVRYRRAALMHRARRYGASGVISHDIAPRDLRDEFDFAQQGALVHTGDRWVMLAGEDRDPVFAWDADADPLLEWGTQPADPDRFAAVDMSLEQSAPADYTKAALPRLVSGEAVSLRSALLVTHPIDGGRLLATYRRRALAEQRFAFATLPTDPRVYSLKRGDVVTLTLRDAGLDASRCTVEAITIRSDMTVLAEFTLTPTGAYADTISLPGAADRPVPVLPPLTERRVGYPFFVLDRDGLELKLVPRLQGHRSLKWAITTGDADNPPANPTVADVRGGACTKAADGDEVLVHTFEEGEAAIVRVAALFYRDAACLRGESTLVTAVHSYEPGGGQTPTVTWSPATPTGPDPSNREAFNLTATSPTDKAALFHRDYLRGATPGDYTRIPASGHAADPVEAHVEVARPAEGATDRLIEAYAETEAGVESPRAIIVVDGDAVPAIDADLVIDPMSGRAYLTVSSLDGDTGSYRGAVAVGTPGQNRYPAIAFDSASAAEFSGSRTTGGQNGGAMIGVPFALPGPVATAGQAYFVSLYGLRTSSHAAAAQSTSKRSPVLHRSAAHGLRETDTFLLDRDGSDLLLTPRFSLANSLRWAITTGQLTGALAAPTRAQVAAGTVATAPVAVRNFGTEAERVRVGVLFYASADGTGEPIGGLQTRVYTFDPTAEDLPTVTWSPATPTGPTPSLNEAVTLIALHSSDSVALFHRTYAMGATPGDYTRVPSGTGFGADPVSAHVEVARPAEGQPDQMIEAYARTSTGKQSQPILIAVDSGDTPALGVQLEIPPGSDRAAITVTRQDPDTGSYRGRFSLDGYVDPVFSAGGFSGGAAGGEGGGPAFGERAAIGPVLGPGQTLYVSLVAIRSPSTVPATQANSKRSTPTRVSVTADPGLVAPTGARITEGPALSAFATRLLFRGRDNTVAVSFTLEVGGLVGSSRIRWTVRPRTGPDYEQRQFQDPQRVDPVPADVPDWSAETRRATNHFVRVPSDAQRITATVTVYPETNYGGTPSTASLAIERTAWATRYLSYAIVEGEPKLADAFAVDEDASTTLRLQTSAEGSLMMRGMRVTRSATPPTDPEDGDLWDDMSGVLATPTRPNILGSPTQNGFTAQVRPVAGALGYRWRLSTDSTVTDADEIFTSTGPTLNFRLLNRATDYWLDCRAESATAVSPYSATRMVRTGS